MDEFDWYKARKYLHFDSPLGKKRAVEIASDPKEVSKHAFYPFLSYEIKSKKICKEDGSIRYKPKIRPISYASHADSHIYAYYCNLLSIPYETQLETRGLDGCVLAFRRLGKCNIDFAKDAFSEIRRMGACTAIGFDISGFFNNLDHAQLKEAWCKLIDEDRLPSDHFAVFKSITQYSEVNRNEAYARLGISLNNTPTGIDRLTSPKEFRRVIRGSNLISKNFESKGIPQGSPISAFLSNLYMLEFDELVNAAVEEQGGKYYRYCDDMLFIVPTLWRNRIADFVRTSIKKLEIDINPAKTEIRDFVLTSGKLQSNKPLQYLGFLFDGNQILLRSASLARFSEKMKRGVRFATKANRLRIEKKILTGRAPAKMYRKSVYKNYSHLSKQSFPRYGYRAAQKMESKAIRKQLKPLWTRLQKQLENS